MTKDIVSIYNARRLREILQTCNRAGIPEPEQIFFLSDGSKYTSKHLDDDFQTIREWFLSRSE